MPSPSASFPSEPKCPQCGGRMSPPEIDRRAMRARLICFPCGYEIRVPVKLGPASRSWCGTCKNYLSPAVETCPKCKGKCLPIRELVADHGKK